MGSDHEGPHRPHHSLVMSYGQFIDRACSEKRRLRTEGGSSALPVDGERCLQNLTKFRQLLNYDRKSNKADLVTDKRRSHGDSTLKQAVLPSGTITDKET
ncbi:hypothetical protein ACJ73_07506 [Blastomyces percursus]|uniref:Uncharacterized protein n=1 Tax=Blastomyces percursus TaxID=1658174 RepID=A0A1J9PZ31_9EURO|nr:hypothetical protein ACJ73_07506 [Blastomyces percursus]